MAFFWRAFDEMRKAVFADLKRMYTNQKVEMIVKLRKAMTVVKGGKGMTGRVIGKDGAKTMSIVLTSSLLTRVNISRFAKCCAPSRVFMML